MNENLLTLMRIHDYRILLEMHKHKDDLSPLGITIETRDTHPWVLLYREMLDG